MQTFPTAAISMEQINQMCLVVRREEFLYISAAHKPHKQYARKDKRLRPRLLKLVE